jgi:hypothetical protein
MAHIGLCEGLLGLATYSPTENSGLYNVMVARMADQVYLAAVETAERVVSGR